MRIALWLIVAAAVVAAILLAPLPWPDALTATRVVDAIDIAAPPERVFAYVTAPVNWPRWHPQSRAVSGVIDRTPRPGEKTIEDFEIAGRKGRATWTSVAVDAPRRWEFEGSGEGGGTARLVYTLEPRSGGTHFERELVYRGPNLAFAIVNALQLRAVMEADSAEALRRLKHAIEASPQAS
ncbi:MAG TPA: SRPBCC family protein [Casimicrobiaceae bacterium]|nr:SRPBCC family protein [Casimicrobiaceae bacterium]